MEADSLVKSVETMRLGDSEKLVVDFEDDDLELTDKQMKLASLETRPYCSEIWWGLWIELTPMKMDSFGGKLYEYGYGWMSHNHFAWELKFDSAQWQRRCGL
ncbi:uncharacterized protein LOC120091792 [Benincasa hispida]|uniref:uncharacterized protein LOC120091792 n=1 Tax=Benincasa hispida TaxID=102211 RepID=UPI00190025A0|nr:uncharacterized protein LOC120091792 [Benincasa hispida]